MTAPPFLVYAITYRTFDPRGQSDYARLGHFTLRPDGVALGTYWRYDAWANELPQATRYTHPPLGRAAGDGRPAGAPGPVQAPKVGAAMVAQAGSWRARGDLLEVQFGDAVHQWAAEPDAPYAFRPVAVRSAGDGTNTVGGQTWVDVCGYGETATAVTLGRPLARADLPADFRGGEFRFRLKEKGRPPRWVTRPEQLLLSRFDTFQGGNVLGTAWEDDTFRPPMRVYSTVALNVEADPLRIYFAGGHDYSGDGALNEFGHTIAALAVWTGDRVGAVVFIECSYQTDRVALIGAGRYTPA